jgi:hypothetical protein
MCTYSTNAAIYVQTYSSSFLDHQYVGIWNAEVFLGSVRASNLWVAKSVAQLAHLPTSHKYADAFDHPK